MLLADASYHMYRVEKPRYGLPRLPFCTVSTRAGERVDAAERVGDGGGGIDVRGVLRVEQARVLGVDVLVRA